MNSERSRQRNKEKENLAEEDEYTIVPPDGGGDLYFTLGLLFGVAVCLVFTPIIVNISFYFNKKRALATGIAICGSGAGTFVFVPVVNALLETNALRGTFLILVSVLFLNNIGLSMSGLLIIACPLCISYYQLLMVSITLGLFTSCTAVTRPILLGELLGLENVNNAYGFMLVFSGVATLFGTLMAMVYYYDTSGDYHNAFYLAGSSILLSALLCYPLGKINRWEKS
uniref:Major facilitator superfamily (MFS) profile domain-containing protein n=1 Tax=Daphnia galeata TaxID=27404 RepID=A0A8J2WCU3_9CRUS|nr:unnamed protein product [Daphnia galeata]